MSIEKTALYKELSTRLPPSAPPELIKEFDALRRVVSEESKYIVLQFPEYTPHDHTRHLDHLFILADRLLGAPLYSRLNASEIALLAFSLYSHDWGMAVSERERGCLAAGNLCENLQLVDGEPQQAQFQIAETIREGLESASAIREYLRNTHAARSAVRLRNHLQPIGAVFGDAVAKIAEAHTLDAREIRDVDRYPTALSVFGETVNLAALATYVRMIDLLDLGEDRTPYALWRFVSPSDSVSGMEWKKHRAISPVSINQTSTSREVVVDGCTDDPDVFAALSDLQSWVEAQFSASVVHLRTLAGRYQIDLDSRIRWTVQALGFEPRVIRFETDRSQVLSLLSRELYQNDSLAFIRELLQNSIDAIDTRETLLAQHGLPLSGEITVRLNSSASGLSIDWTDNGIGMDDQVLATYFARLGCSWYAGRDARRIGVIEPISKFGVGILSCFAISPTLSLRTKRDPYLSPNAEALDIQVPRRESHFRVRTTADASIGTTISLRVPPAMSDTVSIGSVSDALTRIARYVRHNVSIESNGVKINIAPSFKQPELVIQGMRGDAANALSSLTVPACFEIGNQASDFHGHYATLVPRKPLEVTSEIDTGAWTLGDQRIDLDDVLLETERAWFVKGVRTGSVLRSKAGRYKYGDEIIGARSVGWIPPRLFLNICRPSLMEFDLGRSSVRLTQPSLLTKAWREIAAKLRDECFNWPLVTPLDRAVLLGACAVFGMVPIADLEGLLPHGDIPVLVLEAGCGLTWSGLRDVESGREFLETPFEMGYAFAHARRFGGFGAESGLRGWAGERAVFLPGTFEAHSYPWLKSVIRFARTTLAAGGWEPVEMRCVQALHPQDLPLVCRVWQKPVESKNQAFVEHSTMLSNLYSEAPQVLRFPNEVSDFAAFGSRYWNGLHPKIISTLSALKELSTLREQRRLSTTLLNKLGYLCSSRFYDYVVPSRFSSRTLAIDLINKLLELAREAGVTEAEPLFDQDFVPGTITGYSNPYQFDLSGWDAVGTGLGSNLREPIH